MLFQVKLIELLKLEFRVTADLEQFFLDATPEDIIIRAITSEGYMLFEISTRISLLNLNLNNAKFSIPIISSFLQTNSNVKQGTICTWHACEVFDLNKIQYLVGCGANVNGSKDRIPPLLSALHSEQISRYLLVNNTHDPAVSPIYVACAGGRRDIVKILMEYERADDLLLFVAQDETIAKRLILLGANVNGLNSAMKTPLSNAMENRKFEEKSCTAP